jgi:hypothetical protein
MNERPMLSKMEALLKKHRGGDAADPGLPASTVEPQSEMVPHAHPPADAWLPVLTHVIARGTPPEVAHAAAPDQRVSTAAADPVPDAPPPPESQTSVVDTVLAEQLMSELAPRLSEVMEKQVAAELRKNLDQTVATLLSQLDVNVREIVREAVAEKLKQTHDPSA